MLESNFVIAYFCIIIALQSIIGVGVLVLGTPFLLILNFNIIEIFFILLPISIITSLTNLLIINFSNKKLHKSSYKEFKKFFIICIPSIFIGLLILKFFENFINFKLFVCLVIVFSIILVILKDRIKYKINFFRISILSGVGIIHGLTNSGGTLMSLALSANNKKDYARFNTTFFYLILAIFQYILTNIVFFENFIYPSDTKLIWALTLGIILGNLTNHYLKSTVFYRMIVNFLALLSALVLLIP